MNRACALVPLLLLACLGAAAQPAPGLAVEYEADRPPERQKFRELWAYLMQNEEAMLPYGAPITDLAYFSARLSIKGELYGVPPVDRLAGHGARKHLVVAEVSNQAILHFVLTPQFGLRDKLVADIAAAAAPYDGVVIDFEQVPSYDAAAFLEFLSLLDARLGQRTLTVCVPARTRKLEDAYDYARISAVADRLFVMAYDEHWSGSAAGAIASIAWSTKVAAYALSVAGPGKLVMGMPFYGRAWGDKNPSSAYRYSSARNLLEEKAAVPERDAEGIPFFRYVETVNVVLWFDDAASISKRAAAFRAGGVAMVGFWRLGQEDPAVWETLAIGE